MSGVRPILFYPRNNPTAPAIGSRVGIQITEPPGPPPIAACSEDLFAYANGAFGAVAVPPWFSFIDVGGVSILAQEVVMGNSGTAVYLKVVGAPCVAVGVAFPNDGEQSLVFRGFTDTGNPGGGRGRSGTCSRGSQPVITKFAYAAWYQQNPDGSGVVALIRWTDGANTLLVSAALALSPGDKMALRTEGSSPTTLSLKVNDSVILTTTDGLAELQVGGSPGFGFFDTISTGGVNGTTVTWDDYQVRPLS